MSFNFSLLSATSGLILGAFCLASVSLPPAFSQGTTDDYARGAKLSAQFGNAVFRQRITPNWSADGGSFWYRIPTGPDSAEFVWVNAAKGLRRAAFDHAALAKAISAETKTKVEADKLPFRQIAVAPDGSWVRFRLGAVTWQTDVKGSLQRSPEPMQIQTLAPIRAARASRSGGADTSITFVNQTGKTLTLFWIDTDGNPVKYNAIAPGETLNRGTFDGHVWQIKDETGRSLGVFEAQSDEKLVVLGGTGTTENVADKAATPPRRRRAAPTGEATSPLLFLNNGTRPIRLTETGADEKTLSSATLEAGASLRFDTVFGRSWKAVDAGGKTLGTFSAGATGARVAFDDGEVRQTILDEMPAADLQKRAFVRANNVYLRGENGQEIQLTKDGSAQNAFQGPLQFSPDGKFLVVSQVQPEQKHPLTLVESSPTDQLQPKVKVVQYLKPGDRVEIKRPRLFDVAARREIPTDDALFANPFALDEIGWSADGERYLFLFNQRGHQYLRVISMDRSGAVRAAIDEKSATFVDYSQKTYYHQLPGSNEMIWASERDGWNQLYLYDTKTGAVKNQITKGDWVMREVVRVDDAARQIYFRAFGMVAGQDPYYSQLARINFDGSGLTILTDGDGNHTTQFSPDNRFLIDTFSRVDMAPVSTLRDAQSGKMICDLERSDLENLKGKGWSVPERFTALGRDGKTPIYGVIIRPSNFDPAKKYPVVEDIYAGPHDFFTPKSFGILGAQHEMAELGFIVVKLDGMGTNWRSRAFHDVCWKNVKDAGFPDRIAWMKAAGATRPWMDLSRVGVFGVSAGGQNALGALLFHGDFYKAAFSDCGCHDNRMDKIWWNEAWMGWPIGPEYADNSNVVHAANLTGKLFLTVGEMDTNVDPASTLQVVNALVKAGKKFDYLMVPGGGHGSGSQGEYGAHLRGDFFIKNLLNVEPPNRNAS